VKPNASTALRWFRALWCAALLLAAGHSTAGAARRAKAEKPAKMERADQTSFVIELLAGDWKEQGGEDEGLLTVKTPAADQILYWNIVTVSLRERADYERDLIVKAGEGTKAKTDVGELVTRKERGRPAISWSGTLDKTVLRSTLVDCKTHHVLLTTKGPEENAVEDVHARSLKSLKCKTRKK